MANFLYQYHQYFQIPIYQQKKQIQLGIFHDNTISHSPLLVDILYYLNININNVIFISKDHIIPCQKYIQFSSQLNIKKNCLHLYPIEHNWNSKEKKTLWKLLKIWQSPSFQSINNISSN